MSRFFSLTVLAGILSLVSSREWVLNSKTTAALVTGVGAGTDEAASAAAGDNGTGAFVERWENGQWVKSQIQAGMLLDSVTTPSGNTIATSIWGVFLSTDNGATFNTLDTVSGVSQSANIYGPKLENFALVGSFAVADPNGGKPTSVTGVAVSQDAGATWSVTGEVPYARYGSFPSENTWYVASGMWGSSAVSKVAGTHALTSRFNVHKKHGFSFSEEKNLHVARNSSLPTGWFGAVTKTTDGGKTWTKVFSTDLETDYLYFNGISCSSDSHCVVVAEGEDANGGYLTTAYVTFDAGATWKPTLTTADVGLMQAKFINENEAWVAGTGKSGRNINGQFYKTTDGGLTWKLEQSLANCFAIDMDFPVPLGTKGFAACSSSSGTSCSVAEYI
eukprot:gene25849-32346_t